MSRATARHIGRYTGHDPINLWLARNAASIELAANTWARVRGNEPRVEVCIMVGVHGGRAHDDPRGAPRRWQTAAVGFARKEAELRHIMAALWLVESRALASRLSYPKDGDQLAAMFMRLTADRRARLINVLADARRREALMHGALK